MDDQAVEAVVDGTETSVEEYVEEPQETEDSLEPEEGESPEPEDEYEELDYEGKKYAVPKELREAFLRQSDYTRKTQELAEQRKTFETQREQLERAAQMQSQNLQAYAHLSALDSQLQQYQSIDWTRFSNDDPVQAQQAWFQYQTLKDQRQQIAGHISQTEQQTLQQLHQQRAQMREKGLAQLQSEIPHWSAELAGSLAKAGVDAYGFQPEEMANVIDPRMVKVLHDAYQYRQIMAKAKAKPSTPEAKPIRSVKGKGPVRKDPEKMSTEEWMAWRNNQVANRN